MFAAILLDRPVFLVIVGYATLKGVAISLVATAITHSLGDALIIAAVSGTLGIIGMVAAAWITVHGYRDHLSRDMDRVEKKIGTVAEDVKQAVRENE